jgi:uncharacterized protein YutD
MIKTKFGNFEILVNHREAFDLEAFENRYVDVAFDRYTYLVGDLSAETLRIKAFGTDPKSNNGYKKIPEYLNEFCNHNAAYYILKRIKGQTTPQKESKTDE